MRRNTTKRRFLLARVVVDEYCFLPVLEVVELDTLVLACLADESITSKPE